MTRQIQTPNDLDDNQYARYIITLFHRTILHYALWFTEVRHQMGTDRAMEMLDTAFSKSFGIQMKRLSKTLGFDMADGLPAALVNIPRQSLSALADAACTNWLANDGVWFQSVEFTHGMNEAKRCNDSTWAQFSPVEAMLIKRFLNLGDRPGIDGLKQALGFRMYANINVQSIRDDGPDAIVFCMNECRVQSARKRKNLADYPCKSAGQVEYTYFARAIDDRIRTECVGCPPDDHPDDWFCAWRFFIPPDKKEG